MTRIARAVTLAVEVIVFDIVSPLGCIAVKGKKGLREVISRRKEERRQKEASENKEEKK